MNHWPHTPNSHFQFTGGESKTQVSVTTCLIGGIEVFALNSLLCRHVLQQNFSCCRRQLLFCWAISRLMVPWGLQACDWHILSSQRWKNNQPTKTKPGNDCLCSSPSFWVFFSSPSWWRDTALEKRPLSFYWVVNYTGTATHGLATGHHELGGVNPTH